MDEMTKRLIADAALSRYATGSDKSFCDAYEFIEDDEPSEFDSYDAASEFIEQYIRTIDWVFNRLQEIVTDAVHTHVTSYMTEEGLGQGGENGI